MTKALIKIGDVVTLFTSTAHAAPSQDTQRLATQAVVWLMVWCKALVWVDNIQGSDG